VPLTTAFTANNVHSGNKAVTNSATIADDLKASYNYGEAKEKQHTSTDNSCVSFLATAV
jgi:hypothetical protein